MAEIGKFNDLTVVKKVDFGVYLDGGGLGEILLPGRYVPKEIEPDDVINVFIYLDSEDRIIATTEIPLAVVGEFALLKVVSISKFGAFLDWGLPKDLLVPFREQKQKMEEGKSYIVYVYLDDESLRIAATAKVDKFLDKMPIEYIEGDKVELLIYDKTDIGYKAIIESSHWGILYDNEVFQNIKKGQLINGFIKKIREDKKIDLCLQKPGFEKVDDLSEKILNLLQESDGFIPVTDKSPPDIIRESFGVSKKTFKKSIGALYKQRIITIDKNGIKLN